MPAAYRFVSRRTIKRTFPLVRLSEHREGVLLGYLRRKQEIVPAIRPHAIEARSREYHRQRKSLRFCLRATLPSSLSSPSISCDAPQIFSSHDLPRLPVCSGHQSLRLLTARDSWEDPGKIFYDQSSPTLPRLTVA